MPDSESHFADAIRTVAIIGPGLIGGSFGLALRKAGFDGDILGVGKLPYIDSALKVGAIDRISTLEDASEVADLLYLSGTVDGILSTIDQLTTAIRSDCIVTDVGSTKSAIVKRAAIRLPSGCFVGGHPLAGKEKRGAENADPDLFRDRPYILTSRLSSPRFRAFIYWLGKMGARLVELEAAQHDATVAFSSHLPQLLSTALACTLAERRDLPVTTVFGSGLADMTRLALSAPDLWESILATNRDQVVSALDAYVAKLSELRVGLLKGEIDNSFEVANAYAYLLRSQ